MKEPKTPELDKLVKVAGKGKSQPIGEFLEWLFSEKKVVLGRYPRDYECTRCGCERKFHDVTYEELPYTVEALVKPLDLTPEQKNIVREKLIRDGVATVTHQGKGCSNCGTSGCPRYVHDEEHLLFADHHADINRILAEYFGINEKKAEEERRKLLEYARSLNRAK